MKVIWEESDIFGGRKYTRKSLSETWQISYLSYAEGEACFVSVSLQDGLVTVPKTRVQLAQDLTNNDYIPVEITE